MPFSLIIDRARWVCEHCAAEKDYAGPGADQRAREGGAEHVRTQHPASARTPPPWG
jgi:hypothetical protein